MGNFAARQQTIIGAHGCMLTHTKAGKKKHFWRFPKWRTLKCCINIYSYYLPRLPILSFSCCCPRIFICLFLHPAMFFFLKNTEDKKVYWMQWLLEQKKESMFMHVSGLLNCKIFKWISWQLLVRREILSMHCTLRVSLSFVFIDTSIFERCTWKVLHAYPYISEMYNFAQQFCSFSNLDGCSFWDMTEDTARENHPGKKALYLKPASRKEESQLYRQL